MEPEERDPRLLVDWGVVEIGLRQAWPFVGFTNPSGNREVRLYIDSDISVLPANARLNQDDDRAVMQALCGMVGLHVTGVSASPETLEIHFTDTTVVIDGAGNHFTVQSPWWLGSVR